MSNVAVAQTLWCPLVRHSDTGGGSFNRGRTNTLNDHLSNEGALCHCVADECAMWRWTFPRPASAPAHPLRDGYCGLAGPQALWSNADPTRQ